MTPQERLDTVVHGSALALQDVHPELSERTYSVIYDLAQKEGLYFAAQMGLRSLEEQDALYAQGRLPIDIVNQKRAIAKMADLSASENAHKVTDLQVGFHNFGLAVDLVEDGDPDTAGVQWSWKRGADFLKIGKYAKAHGLEWGGLWVSLKDLPHVQLTAGLALHDCVELYRAGGLDSVYDEVSKRLNQKGPNV